MVAADDIGRVENIDGEVEGKTERKNVEEVAELSNGERVVEIE